MMHEERRWFVGIDWASQEHVVSLCDGEGKKIGQREFIHGGTGISDMIAWLVKASGGEPGEIHVAIETPHGPIVEALLERGFNVYCINPKQLDRFRDRFTVSGAKDDSLDSYVLADSLRTDMPLYRQLSVAEPLIVELREWSRIDEELKVERIRLANRLRDQLWRYYPQMLELGELDEDWMLDLWEAAPTPQKAARASKAAIARVLKKHRIRRRGPGVERAAQTGAQRSSRNHWGCDGAYQNGHRAIAGCQSPTRRCGAAARPALQEARRARRRG